MVGIAPAVQGVIWVSIDKRGSGLSSRNISNYSLESRVSDVIAVADDLGFETFALGGLSEGGPIALATAATYPGRITRLVIHGSYACGECLGGSADMRSGLRAVIKAEWGVASKLISDLFTNQNSVINGEQFADYQRVAANQDDARKILDAAIGIDVRSLLS